MLVPEGKFSFCGLQVCGLVWDALWGGKKNEGLGTQTYCHSLAIVILGKSVYFSEPQCLFQLYGCIGRSSLLLFQLEAYVK